MVGALDGTWLTGLTLSSRTVLPGDLYVAPAGSRTHGARFAADAVAAGAAAGAGVAAYVTGRQVRRQSQARRVRKSRAR